MVTKKAQGSVAIRLEAHGAKRVLIDMADDRTRSRGVIASLAALTLILTATPVLVPSLVPQPAAAHPVSSFTACSAYRRSGGDCSTDGASYGHWMTVHVRGKVRPVHASSTAIVLRRPPCEDPRSHYACPIGAPFGAWERVGTVRVSEYGKMRFSWNPDRRDAVQCCRPYEFRFKIPGHGASNKTEAWVLYGE